MTAFVVKPERPPVPDLAFARWRRQAARSRIGGGKSRWSICGPPGAPPAARRCRRWRHAEPLRLEDFEVVAISVDKGGAKVAAAFLDETKATEL